MRLALDKAWVCGVAGGDGASIHGLCAVELLAVRPAV